MKLLVLLSCILAAVTAWSPSTIKFFRPQHTSIVPVDTLDEQHAKAAQFAVLVVAEAHSNPGYGHQEDFEYQLKGNDDDSNTHKNDYGQAIQPNFHHHIAAHHLDYSQEHPVIGHYGHLLDTAEDHFAAVHEGHLRKRRSAETYVHTSSLPDHQFEGQLSDGNTDAHDYQSYNHQHQLSDEINYRQINLDDQHHLLDKINNAHYYQSFENTNMHAPSSHEIRYVNNEVIYQHHPQFHQLRNKDHPQQSYQTNYDNQRHLLNDNNAHQHHQSYEISNTHASDHHQSDQISNTHAPHHHQSDKISNTYAPHHHQSDESGNTHAHHQSHDISSNPHAPHYHQSYEIENTFAPHSYKIGNVNHEVNSDHLPQFHQISYDDQQQQSYQMNNDQHSADNNDNKDAQSYRNNAHADTYKVQKARAQHLLAHAAAKSNSHKHNTHQIDAPHAPIEASIGHNGEPLDTAEVEHAKALHFAALQHEVPSIGHDGKPLDTAEVQHAKALHFAAHQQAASRNSLHGYQHVGPVDTNEVQRAKLQHFAAYAAAKNRHH